MIETLLTNLNQLMQNINIKWARESAVRHSKHRIYVRTTNLAERSFEEERRRTKIIPCFLTNILTEIENKLAESQNQMN